LNLYAVNNNGGQVKVLGGKTGSDLLSLRDIDGTTALTWGVFPRREIIQPTIFDPETFLVWSEEAFSLWEIWADAYDEGSESFELLETVSDTFFLCALVDDDYVGGEEEGKSIFDLLIKLEKEEVD